MVKYIKTIYIGLLLTLICVPAFAMQSLNMTPGVTPISHNIYNLHMIIFSVCALIGIGVYAVLVYSLIKHRRSKGFKAATFHGNTAVEIIWTLIPLLILIAMAIPATRVLMRMNDDSNAQVNIKITGYQWKWRYEYLDEGISFFSNLSTPQAQINNKEKKGKWYLKEVDHPLVVPIHQKIRFLVTSNDVVHSWWVPALGVKRDAIPGFINESWAKIDKPGTYRGQCAELCGMNHGYMPIVVIAKTETDYKKWVAEQTGQKQHAAKNSEDLKPMSKADLMALGKKTYEQHCAVCHKADGSGLPPAFPAMKGSKIANGPANAHIDIVLHGAQGTAMQAFKDQLDDKAIAAVVTYERNGFGNKGSVVQPKEVAARR